MTSENTQKPHDRMAAYLNADMTAVNDLIRDRMASEHAPRIPEVTAHLVEAGGKRLRPMLTLAAARLCGYDGPYHVHLAATVEFIHTATLLHDDVVEADIDAMPLALRQRQFDHVLANPPYFDRHASVAATNSGRETALGEATPLETWVKIAAKRLAPKGQAHFIHRAERLPDLIRALPHDMGSIEVLPIAPRIGRMAELVILRARKSGRGAFRLNAPLIMHEGAQHLSDGDSYVPEIRAVLREGAALPF